MAATAALAFSIGGAVVSASGQVRAGAQQQRIAEVNAQSILETSELNAQLIEEGSETNAQIAEYNARMLEAKGRDAIRRGFDEETRYRIDVRGVMGKHRASYAAHGVDVSVGSPVDVITDTAYQGDLDALMIRTNAAREAWGFKVAAEDEYMQASAQRKLGRLQAKTTRQVGRSEAMSVRMGGSYARSAGNYGAFSTLMGAAGQALYQQYGFRRATR